jgi:quinol monooxygenase YgiN
VAEQCKLQRGSLGCSVYEDATDDHTIMFEGKWTNEEDMTDFLRTGEYHKVLILMESALEKPEIRFDTILASDGIEAVEKARNSHKSGSGAINS